MSDKDVTKTLSVDARAIAMAVDILAGGGLVAVPTETVYGLAARADDDAAVAKIYAAKGRPDFNPLIVHVRDLDHAQSLGNFSDLALELAEAHWPGPLTLVVPRRKDARLAAAVTAQLPTIALRVPAHTVMQAVLRGGDFALAAPSANRSGFISPTRAEHVLASLEGRIDLVLDGGPCMAGVESTIIAVDADSRASELRPGPLDLGPMLNRASDTADTGITAPGQLASHYAPGKPVRLSAAAPEPDEFMIGFGETPGDCTLSASGDLSEAARRLYACLHEGAEAARPRIAIAPVPEAGMGRAINDRLRRAAEPD